MTRILPVIVLSQFLGTSVWFAGNAVLPDLVKTLHLSPAYLAHLTSAVQFGFITGTLIFAIMTIADRFSPSNIFFTCSLFAALTNLVLAIGNIQPTVLLASRFLTGFFLAGIYPVGMKIAADHFEKALGKSLGWLVGALVFGTALPHLLKTLTVDFEWRTVVFATSALAFLGGISIVLFVPDGPFRKKSAGRNFGRMARVFSIRKLRGAAFGYFGHMWELYTFWAFVPVILLHYNHLTRGPLLNVALWSFTIIASGGLACIISGLLSQRFGAWKIAITALFLSGCCCILSPLILGGGSSTLLLVFLVGWGMFVVADSPLFSTMVAQNAPSESRGSILTIVNCIGFTLTILSIQFINLLSGYLAFNYLLLMLSVGPILGIIALLRSRE